MEIDGEHTVRRYRVATWRARAWPTEKTPASCLPFWLVVTSTSVTVEFEQWYQSEYSRLVNNVALVTGDRGLAADSVAEAFARALARWERVRRMEHRSAWVYRVAVNQARRTLRRSSHERRLLQAQASTTPLVQPPVEGDHELWAAVARLPERTRAAVVLRYVGDMTEPAIAKALGVRRGTVATMLHRAHIRLAAELDSPAPLTSDQEHTDAIPR